MSFRERWKAAWKILWGSEKSQPPKQAESPYTYVLNMAASECSTTELWHKFIEILADKSGEINLPQNEIEALARCFLPDIISFFESEEGKREFEEWKLQRDANKAVPAEEEEKAS